MKRTAAWLAAVFLACAALITAVKFRSANEARAAGNISAEERNRVATFWATYDRASAVRTKGEFARAAELYREALRFNPTHEDSLYYLGSCLYELGEYAEAEQQLRSLIALNPESGRAYGQLGRLLSVDAPGAPRDLPAARQAFERELQIYTEQAGPLLELGGLEVNQGNLPRAEEDFRAATRLGSAEAEFLLGYALFLQGRWAEAERSFDKVLAKYRADRKLTSKGVLSEGDILPDPSKPLTALQRAALESMVLSYWNSKRPGTPAERELGILQVRERVVAEPPARAIRMATSVRADGRAAWADFAGDGHAGLAVGGKNFALYRWQAGQYVDVTRAAGLAGIHDVWEPFWVDLGGNDRPDLYLVRSGWTGSGQSLLYRNQGDGTFVDVTAAIGLAGKRSTTRACFGNFTGSGRPDLLEVGAAGTGSSIRLFRNTGTRFVDVTSTSGLVAAATAVDCAIADYDGDGNPDVFVQFWRHPARLFRNQGGGKFVDFTQRAGLAGVGAQGYSSIFLDYDRDGRPDLLVAAHAPLEEAARWFLQPQAPVNCATSRLFHNQGDGTFREATREAGLDGCYPVMQAVAADLDGDGWPDLLLANGGPEAEQLGTSVVLRNVSGKFAPWAELPASATPANYIGAAVAPAGSDGEREVYLTSGPLPGRLERGGLFRISAARRVQAAAPRHDAHEGRSEANR
ncbi:MAG TPA: FG-GAP-like repeat-containing protein [Terriglobales bacterium]|nr:FG-GAP-like repeat-containing protein [Terriglobales bacterium]